MRYRVYFVDETQLPIEFEAFDLKVVSARRIKAYRPEPKHNEDSIDLYFGSDIKKINDNHGRNCFTLVSE